MRGTRQCGGSRPLIVVLGMLALLCLLGIFPNIGLVSGQQASAATVLVNQTPTLGAVLTDPHGMTLYIRTSDTGGVSSCNGQCAGLWPPFQPPSPNLTAPDGVTGTLAIMTRNDGIEQVTYNGMPLYHYLRDLAPGDNHGQGVDSVWLVAVP